MQTGKITALYVRFSYDDGTDTASESIEHQKSLLKTYAENNGFKNLSYYADDGYTGTNFNRPDFQRMMCDIKNGLVETVIVKDMSRLGRNYLMVGQYVEFEFPRYHVRFIAISDNVDSAKETNELLPFSNLMNEYYSKDISKKVRAMICQKGNSGLHTTTNIPYGYYNHSEDKQHWEIDEIAAKVIRKIFDLYLNHSWSANEIANYLKAQHVLRPKYHRMLLRGIAVNDGSDDLYVWNASVIRDILHRQEYVGDTVNFRTMRASYKSKKIIRNPNETFVIFPDTHPAIIDRVTFQKVQDKQRKQIHHANHRYLFADQLFCMECHSRMHGRQIKYKGKLSISTYECSAYKKVKACYFHGVCESYLHTVVLEKIQQVLSFAKNEPYAFDRLIQNIINENSDSNKTIIKQKLEETQLRIAEINKYIQGLTEARMRGEIDGSLFASLKKTYDDEKFQLNNLIADFITKINSDSEVNQKIKILYTAIGKYDTVTELTPEILTDFIEKIEVGKLDTENKALSFDKRKNPVSVFFWGVGVLQI